MQQHPGKPVPAFIQLAKHILSVSANSASCERLFSLFGIILTKLRNRLGTDNLLKIAEFKMHIRDERARNGTKQRLKRIFGDRKATTNPASAADVPHVTTPVPVEQTAPLAAATITEDYDDDTADDSDESDEDTEDPETFSGMVHNLTSAVTEDDEDCEPVDTNFQRTTIEALFDFTEEHWVQLHTRSAMSSFDDELALYQMLDLDAEGEDDPDVQVDEITTDILVT